MTSLLIGLILLQDPVPKPEDVKAGWWGLAVFLGLILVMVFVLRSLVRHLRTTNRNAEAGAFDASDRRGREAPGPRSDPRSDADTDT